MSEPLWKIADEIERVLIDGTDHETGEISEDAIARLDGLEMARDAKALAVARYAIGEWAEGEKVKAQADRLAKRAKIHKNRGDRLEAYLDAYLSKPVKLSDDVVQIGMRKSSSVFVPEDADLATWPEQFVKLTREAKKKPLSDAIKAGEEVPAGVVIQEKNRVVIK